MHDTRGGWSQAGVRTLLLAAVGALAALLLVLQPPEGADPLALKGAAVVLLAIALWATAALAEYLTAVLFFFLTLVLEVAPPPVVFAGFHSTAVWLVFGGLIIGLAVQKSGLATRAVALLLALVGSRYARLVWALSGGGLLLAFLVPSSMGRVLLLLPIVVALADELGFEADSKGRIGLVLAAAMGTMLPAFSILTANVPNMALIGAAESIYGLEFLYGSYLFLNFPVLGLATALAVPLLILLFFPASARGRERPPQSAAERPASLSAQEKRLLAIMTLTVSIWAIDFAHGLAPAWVALGAACALLWPRYGVIPASALREVNFAPWIFVAGVIGLGAVASHTGAADLVGTWVLAHLHLSSLAPWQQYAGILGLGMLVGLLTGIPASPGVMTPLAAELARQSGWPVESVLLAQVPTWVVFPFVYQAPPLMVALTLAQIPITRSLGVMLTYFAFGLLVSLPLHYLWGRALGIFP